MRSKLYKSFIPECFLDTNLVEVLLSCENEVNHKKGNSSLLSSMDHPKQAGLFLVALIDDDKVKVKKLDDYIEVVRLRRHNLKLFRHPDRKHFVIQVSPAIERWVLNQCENATINLSNFNVPGDIYGLKALKGLSQRNDQRFKQLFKAMLKNENCKGIIELKRWLTFFFDNNYNTDLDLL